MPQRTISAEDVVRELLRGSGPRDNKQRVILTGSSGGGTGSGPLSSTPPAKIGMKNPMTQVGAMIVGGVDGAPKELSPGTNGFVLTMVGGIPTWATVGTGFPGSPAQGDIVYYSGSAWVVLPIGTLGQVLTVTNVSGDLLPRWGDPSVGGLPDFLVVDDGTPIVDDGTYVIDTP
jgi:hypothetical protein